MKQWAVKLTLDYGLVDHAHKENQTLVNGKGVPSYPRSLHPHDPFPSPRGVKIFEGKAVVGGIGDVRAGSLFFAMSEAGPSKELTPGRLHGGRFSPEGWWVAAPTRRSPNPAGEEVHGQHGAQVPSDDVSPPRSCLPSHHYQVGWIFLLGNIFCYDKLWFTTILLTPKWGCRLQKGWSIQPPIRKCRNVPNTEIAWEIRVMTMERVLGSAASDAALKRHFSLLCASHQHSPKHCIKNYSF